MSKNNIQQTEWNKVDYYYGIGTLIDDNHLDYREEGYGAHLPLQMYLSEDLNFTKFIQNHGLITSTEEQSIPLNNMEIVNAFNYMETYKNEK